MRNQQSLSCLEFGRGGDEVCAQILGLDVVKLHSSEVCVRGVDCHSLFSGVRVWGLGFEVGSPTSTLNPKPHPQACGPGDYGWKRGGVCIPFGHSPLEFHCKTWIAGLIGVFRG